MQYEKKVIIYLKSLSLEDILFFKRFKSIVKTIDSNAHCAIVLDQEDASSKTESPLAIVESAKRIASKLQEESLPVMPVAAHYLGSYNEQSHVFTFSTASVEKFFRMSSCPIISPVIKTTSELKSYNSVDLALALLDNVSNSLLFFLEYKVEDKRDYLNVNFSSVVQRGSIVEFETQVKTFLCL